MGLLGWEGLQKLWTKIKNTFLPLSGGAMKGDINLGTDKGFTGTTASGNKFDIFRVLNSTRLQVGGTYPALEFKGKNDRPTYNGNDMALYSDIPSGGSGDSSIIDLGQQGRHKEAQQAIVDHLTQPTVTDGCYVFKYWCDCYGNACLAVVLKRTADTVYIEGTVYDNSFSYREFKYRQDMGLTVDGCWKEIGSSNSIPFTYFTCYSPSRTVRELIDQLANEGVDTTDSITAVVSFSAMLSGTFLCTLSHYYDNYYGCNFTDLTNLKTYYLEGESQNISLYDNLSNGGGSSEASMPRIRLANWKYTEIPTFGYNEDGNEYFISGGIAFSVNVQDGTVQEGDELQVCSLRTTFGKRKLRPILTKTISDEDIENLAKQPFLRISTDHLSGNNLGNSLERAMQSFYYTDSNPPEKWKPKYIRIRRPIYTEEGEVANAYFSNVVPVDIRLKKTFLE